jgi:hypothetical protein
MLPEAMNSELTREPFVPLRIYLDDGRTYVIRDSSLCLINHGSMYIARIDRPHSRLADDLDVISLRHVVSVEQVPDEEQRTGKVG